MEVAGMTLTSSSASAGRPTHRATSTRSLSCPRARRRRRPRLLPRTRQMPRPFRLPPLRAPAPERPPAPPAAPPVSDAAPAVGAATPPVSVPARPVPAPAVRLQRSQPRASPTAAVPPPRTHRAGVVHEEPALTDRSRPPDTVASPVAAATRPLTAADARRSSAVAPTHAPTAPQLVRSSSSRATVLYVFGAAAVLVAGLVAAFLAARKLAAAPVREPEATPAGTGVAALDSYIHFDALLLDDADLLREQHAPHRACLHDLRRRHPSPS